MQLDDAESKELSFSQIKEEGSELVNWDIWANYLSEENYSKYSLNKSQ